MSDVVIAGPALPGSPPVAAPPEEERRRVARLFSRAGFGASVDEIDQTAAKGYAAAVDALLGFAPASGRPDEARILSRASKTKADIDALGIIAMFCGAGLVVALLAANRQQRTTVAYFLLVVAGFLLGDAHPDERAGDCAESGAKGRTTYRGGSGGAGTATGGPAHGPAMAARSPGPPPGRARRWGRIGRSR